MSSSVQSLTRKRVFAVPLPPPLAPLPLPPAPLPPPPAPTPDRYVNLELTTYWYLILYIDIYFECIYTISEL
jgi:hypothetical protein